MVLIIHKIHCAFSQSSVSSLMADNVQITQVLNIALSLHNAVTEIKLARTAEIKLKVFTSEVKKERKKKSFTRLLKPLQISCILNIN